jgi:hypothetical protein
MCAARVLLCALAVIASPRTTVAQSQQFWDHGVRLSITARSTVTTQRVTVAWTSATDGRLSADQYHVSMRLLRDTSWSQDFTTTITSRTVTIPLKLDSRDSVGLRVVVRASRRGVQGTDSVWAVRWFRRLLTTAEKASLDSFPDGNRRFMLCSFYGQRFPDSLIATSLAASLAPLRTATDSAREQSAWEAIRTGPDSLYTPQTGGAGAVLFKGYAYPFVYAGKNRYTGRVGPLQTDSIWSSNPQIFTVTPSVGIPDACVKAMAAWEAERSG